MNYRELYASLLIRRQRLIDTCKGLPKAILTRTNYGSNQTNLLATGSTPSLLDILNQIYQGEEYWLRVALEHEQPVYPEAGFHSIEELEKAFHDQQGSLLLLTGMGPEGGWEERFALPDAPELTYPAEVVFAQFLCNEWRLWGMAFVLLRANGLEPPILDLI